MLMIFLYFLKNVNLPNCLANICFINTRTNFAVEYETIGSLSFLHVKMYHKNSKFVTSFTKNQHLLEVSPIREVSGLLRTLLHRSFNIYCDFNTFY